MTRQNIFEIMKNTYNIPNEINKIRLLFNQKIFYNRYTRSKCTIEEVFNKEILLSWKQRGSFLSCNEIKETLNLPDDINEHTAEEDIIKTVEYYENIFYMLVNKFDMLTENDWEIPPSLTIVGENIALLIEHLNYDKYKMPKDEMVLLIPKNPAATAVAEISSKATALAILKYNHASLKGDLEGKRNILNSIYREYETVLDNPVENYKDFYKKAKQLYNNLHIRHDNKTKTNNKNTVINIDDKELEKWYDELYQLLLFCVLIKDNIDRKAEVEDFLKSIKGAKS